MTNQDPIIIKQLLADLRDVNKGTRRTAIMKLGLIGGDRAVRALMSAVENDYEDLIVRGRAALMLGKLGDLRAVEPLIRALDAPGFQTPFYAAQALGELGDARAVEPLTTMAADSKDKTRDVVVQALKRLGYEAEKME
jgi:HEAT repeat protein